MDESFNFVKIEKNEYEQVQVEFEEQENFFENDSLYFISEILKEFLRFCTIGHFKYL